jgi:hypothetical protein
VARNLATLGVVVVWLAGGHAPHPAAEPAATMAAG